MAGARMLRSGVLTKGLESRTRPVETLSRTVPAPANSLVAIDWHRTPWAGVLSLDASQPDS